MISIITPVLNGAAFIEKNILAVQKLEIPFEHIIVDGGSSDDTLVIVSKYPNVKIVHQRERGGMYHAIHLGILEANGKFVTWVNADDVIISRGYEKLYDSIMPGNADVVYSNAYFIDVAGNRLKSIKGRFFAKYLLQNGIFPFIQPAAVFTRALYEQVGGFDYQNFKIAGDLDLFHKFSLVEAAKFKKINEYSVEFLKHGESLGDKNTALANEERDRAGIPRPNVVLRILNKILSF